MSLRFRYGDRDMRNQEQRMEYDYSDAEGIREFIIPMLEVGLREYKAEMEHLNQVKKESWWGGDKDMSEDLICFRRKQANRDMHRACVEKARPLGVLIKYWKRRLVSPIATSTLAPAMKNYIKMRYEVTTGKIKITDEIVAQVEKEVEGWADSLGFNTEGCGIEECFRDWNEL